MTSLYVRKPRNVRSVYARPHCEDSTPAAEGQEKPVALSGKITQKSTTDRNGKATNGDRRGTKRPIKFSDDAGGNTNGDAHGAKRSVKKTDSADELSERDGRTGKKSKKDKEDESPSASQTPLGTRTSARQTARTARTRLSFGSPSPLRKKSPDPQSFTGSGRRKSSVASPRSPVQRKLSDSKSAATSPVRRKTAKRPRDETEEGGGEEEEDRAERPGYPSDSSAEHVRESLSSGQSPDSKESPASSDTLSLLKRRLDENADAASTSAGERKEEKKEEREEEEEKEKKEEEKKEKEEKKNEEKEESSISKVKPHVCPTCQKRYTSQVSLRQHERVHLQEGGPGDRAAQFPETADTTTTPTPSCGVCRKAFTSSAALAKHRAIHSSAKAYVCEFCGKSFSQANNLKIHRMQHEGQRPFVCEVCHKSYLRNFDLQQHKRLHTGERPYVCNVCGKGFVKMDYLKTHKQVHSGLRPFRCDECPLSFRRNHQLKAHKLIHSGVRSFECDKCKKTFSTKGILKTHELTHRSKTYSALMSSYMCEVCGLNVGRKSSLKTHMMKHSGERPFVCEVCGKGYITKNEWQIHRRTHTGEKPFVCPVCSAAYVRNANLRHHITTAHWGSRPFRCDVCNKAFADRRTLKEHRLIHLGIKPHKCSHCGKSFTQAGALKTHLRTHTGEKPFACKFCSKRFGDMGCRNRHARLHTGEKPYKCSLCPAAFSRLEPYKQHQDSAHGKTGVVSGNDNANNGSFVPQASSSQQVVVCDQSLTEQSSPFLPASEVSQCAYSGSARPPPVVVVQSSDMMEVGASEQCGGSIVEGQAIVIDALQSSDATTAVMDIVSAHMGAEEEHPCIVTDPATTAAVVVGGVGKEGSVCVPDSSIIYETMSSTDGQLLSSGGSGTEVIEYVIIEQGPGVLTEAGREEEEEGEGSSSVNMLQAHMQGGEGSEAMPGVIKVQLRPSRQGQPPQIVGVTLDNTVASDLALGGQHPDVVALMAEQTAEEEVVEVEVVGEDPHPPASSDHHQLLLRQGEHAAQHSLLQQQQGEHAAQHSLLHQEQRQSPVRVQSAGSQTTFTEGGAEAETSEQGEESAGVRALLETHFNDSDSQDNDGGGAGQEEGEEETKAACESVVCDKEASKEGGGVSLLKKKARQAAMVENASQAIKCEAEDYNNAVARLVVEEEEVEKEEKEEEENAVTLRVIGAQSEGGDADSATITVMESSRVGAAGEGGPSKFVHVYQDDGSGNLTLLQTQAFYDSGHPTTVLEHLGSVATSGTIELPDMAAIQILSGEVTTETTTATTTTATDVNDSTTVVEEDKKPVLDTLDQKPADLPPITAVKNRRFNRNRKSFSSSASTTTSVKVDASVLEEVMKTSKRVFGKAKKDWICEVCGKGFTQGVSLRNHIVMQHRTGEGKGSFTCERCGKVCVSRSMLLSHQRSHTGERPFPCTLCPNTYKHKADLRQHILAAHLGKKPHVCQVCHKAFTEKRSLKDHGLIHQGLKPYKCSVCSKPFTQSSSLQNHMRTHSGLRPWVCPFCGKDFSDQSTFNRHQRIHTGEKPYRCDRCPCAFGRSEQLKKHLTKDHAHDLQNLATIAAAVANISEK